MAGGPTNSIGLVINSSNPLSTLNGGIGRSVTPTAGSVLFYDSIGEQQNNSQFFWDNTNHNLYISANSSSQSFSGVASINIQSPTGTNWKNGLNIYSTLDQWPILTLFGFQPNTGSIFFDAYTNGNNTYTSSSPAGNFWIQGAGTNLNFYCASGYSSGSNITWLSGMSMSNSGVINIATLTASQAVVTDSSKNLVSLPYATANTASSLVERDSSGNFSAGTITATLNGNASTATSATTATTATNANNVVTTQTAANASYFPLMVASTSGNQAVDLSTQWTFNPNTLTLNTNNIQASNSLQVGTTTNSAPITVQGAGGTALSGWPLLYLTSPATPVSGNLFGLFLNKVGVEGMLMGINKNTSTGSVAASSVFLSTYSTAGTISIGRGNASGLPSTTDIGIDSSGNVTMTNGTLTVAKNIDITTIGNGLKVAEGTNAKQGLVTLSGGTLVVSNTSVTANSRIFLTCQVPGGTPGFLRVSARTAGTSFTILSSTVLDTSQVAYEIFEPG